MRRHLEAWTSGFITCAGLAELEHGKNAAFVVLAIAAFSVFVLLAEHWGDRS